VKAERLQQSLKQDLEIVSTDEGIQTDRSCAQFEKADPPRIETREPDSNVTLERFLQ
jgi:hypothetical protein